MHTAMLVLCSAGLLAGQNFDARDLDSKRDAPSIKVDVHLVNVSFSVRDAAGKLARDLSADDFEITEDGVAQKIKFFGRAADLPLRLGLLVDGSGSQEHFTKRHQADLERFLHTALSAQDQGMLLGFGNHLRLASGFTSNVQQLSEALIQYPHGSRGMPELDPDDTRSGGTALFDAVYAAALEKLAPVVAARKAIVLLSDGEDNSSAHDVVEAIEAAQLADTLIYTVRYTETKKGRLTARNRYGVTEMNRMARETGGAAFDASKGGISESLSEIAAELRSLYDLGYTTSNLQRDGSFRKIRIAAKKEGLIVRSKSGYYAK